MYFVLNTNACPKQIPSAGSAGGAPSSSSSSASKTVKQYHSLDGRNRRVKNIINKSTLEVEETYANKKIKNFDANKLTIKPLSSSPAFFFFFFCEQRLNNPIYPNTNIRLKIDKLVYNLNVYLTDCPTSTRKSLRNTSSAGSSTASVLFFC